MARKPPRESLPQLRSERAPPGPPATLGNLQRAPGWVWVYCNACRHDTPLAIAPFVIRWGQDAPAARLRAALRCSRCGEAGVKTMRPSWCGNLVGWAPFPVERMAATQKSPAPA